MPLVPNSPVDLTLGELVDRVANHPGWGSRLAVIYRGESITFKEQNSQASVIAAYLQQLTKIGDRVGILLHDSLEIFTAYIACYKAGVIACPINWQNTSREIGNVLLQAKPCVFIIDESRMKDLERVNLNETTVNVVFVFGQCKHTPSYSWATPPDGSLLSTSLSEILKERANRTVYADFKGVVLDNSAGLSFTPSPFVNGDTDAVMMFTSGSTGNPKGVVHSHKTLLAMDKWFAKVMGWEDGYKDDYKHLLCVTSQHSIGVFGQVSMIQNACPCYFGGALGPAEFVELVNELLPTHIFGLTSKFQMMINSSDISAEALQTLKRGVAGGDTVTSGLKRVFFEKTGCILAIAYGSTEAGVNTCNVCDDPDNLSIGLPEEGHFIKIVDLETGEEIEDGKVGEMLIKSNCMFRKYYGNPKGTSEVLLELGWYKTGDLAYIGGDGFLHYCGRIKHMIKYDSKQIYSSDVEEAVVAHPFVRECGAVGKSDPTYGEIPCCFISLKTDPHTGHPHKLTQPELQSYLRNFLASYKIPQQVVIMKELPKGLTGKIDRLKMKYMIEQKPSLAY